jgi:hypothetical protein
MEAEYWPSHELFSPFSRTEYEGGTRMVGMLQIITWLLGIYLVFKGVEILQIGLASHRESRSGLIAIGLVSLGICVTAAVACVRMQDQQASSIGRSGSELNR